MLSGNCQWKMLSLLKGFVKHFISDSDIGASIYKIKMRNVCLEIILELLQDSSSGSTV